MTFVVSIPTKVGIAVVGLLVLIAAAVLVTVVTTSGGKPTQPGPFYGGVWVVTFQDGATTLQRETILQRCGQLPGARSGGISSSGSGTMYGPPASQSGISADVQRQRQAQRQAIITCLKGDPSVATVVEGL